MNSRLATVIFVSALIAQPSLAIDLNGNQMSDVWEQKHEIPADAAAADPDGDNFSNMQESALGSDPHDGLSPSLMEVLPGGQPDEVPLRFHTEKGKRYEAITSNELATWTRVGENEIIGTGAQVTILTTRAPTAERGFFRYRFLGDIDADGDGFTAWEEHALKRPPARPVEFGARANSENSVTLNWTGHSDSTTTFLIERSTDGGLTWRVIATVAGGTNSYTDETVMPGASNLYRLTAQNSAGSTQAASTVNVDFTSPPSPPANLIVTRNADGSTDFTWDNTSSNATYVFLERRRLDGTWERFVTLPPMTSNYHLPAGQ